jgi:uncharacterized phosphosugar-binding protein
LIVALALLTATTALAADSPTPATYADSALSLAGHITAALPAVTAAADSIADRMIAGHTLWLGGSYEGLIVEGYYRAGGMMKAAWLKQPSDLKPGDALLLGTVSAANPADSALITAAHQHGAFVVRIGPAGSTHASPAPDVDLALPCEPVGTSQSLPLISAGDTMMLWTLTGEIVGALTRRGKMTPMFESVLVPGGTARNADHLKLLWEPTCPAPQREGRLGWIYLWQLTHYLRDLKATQLPKFDQVGALVREAIAGGHKAFLIPFGHLPPYEVALPPDPGVFTKLPSDTDGKALAKVVQPGDVVVYIGYYELPRDVAEAAQAAGAKVVSFVSGTPDRWAGAMGADVNIEACWPFGDAAVEVPGYDVHILPPSGVMTSVAYWMLMATQ